MLRKRGSSTGQERGQGDDLVDKIEEAQRTVFILGTIAQFKVYGKNAEQAIDAAIIRLNKIDDKLSVFKPESEIAQINVGAGGVPQRVSIDTFFLLQKSLGYSNLLEGTFDPTIRPLVDLWGIGTGKENIPSENDIQEILKLVNYKDMMLDCSKRSAALKHENQSLDLGGIAKGYAADEVRDIFIKKRIKRAMIDLGGNIFVLGNKTDGTLWKIGVQDPLQPRGEFIGILNLKDKSVVTSGNYEKYFIREGKMFHHIIDPINGYPSRSGLMSVTIISDNSLDGDGLSTGMYILGVDKSMELIEAMGGIDAVFIAEDRKVYLTPGIRDNFQLTNNDYKLG